MVNAQRGALLDPTSPSRRSKLCFMRSCRINSTIPIRMPFCPVTDQPDGADICRDIYGDRVALVPYIMPGFDLAQSCARIWEKHPDVEGLILLKHGIFTFGENARSL